MKRLLTLIIIHQPLFLAGKKFKAHFLFDELEQVIKHELLEAESLLK